MSDPVTAPAPVRQGRGRVRRRLTAEEAKQRRRRFVRWGLSVSLVVLLVNALVGDTGYLATLRVERDEAALRAEYYRVHQENARLKEERARLERDPAALEEAARSIGRIRDGETMVTITELPGRNGTSGEPAR